MNEERRTTRSDRLVNDLAARVADGRFGPGDRLPSERDLGASFGASRGTVRRAIAELTERGLVYAVRGSGTFVASPVIGEASNNLLSFSRLATSRGLTATARVLSVREREAIVEEAERCRTAPGSPVVQLERVRLLDGLPIAVSRSIVPAALAPGALDQDWTTASLYAVLAAAGNAPVRADYAVEAQAVDEATGALLEMEPCAPVLVATSLCTALSGRVVEIGRMVYRGDRYRFRSTLHS